VAEYYSNFARALSEALLREEEQQQKSVTVECVGFLGHYCDETLTSAKTRRWFTLEEQKAHVLKYVRSRVEEEKKRNGENACFLVGHSIGAHVAMHAVKEMREEDVKRMVGLMPFLHVNEKSNVQKFLAWLVSLRVVVRAVAYVLGFMQKFKVLKKMIEKSATRGMKCELGISVTKRWAREMSLVNMALMGDTEFKFLRDWKGNVVDVLKAHAKKISFVYACEDHWGPLHQRDELIKEIGEELEIITDESYKHAFVLDDESSNKLASQCARMLLNNN
jgi:dienelactone hydrolase